MITFRRKSLIRGLALILILASTIVVMVLQPGCKKDEKNVLADFMVKIQGNWTVQMFSRTNNANGPRINIELRLDTIMISTFPDFTTKYYSIYDPVICNIECIENMQEWTFTENNGSLILKTQDLCGSTISYNVDFYDVYFMEETVILGYTSQAYYVADMTVANPDTTITIDNLRMYNDGYNIEFTKTYEDYSDTFLLDHN